MDGIWQALRFLAFLLFCSVLEGESVEGPEKISFFKMMQLSVVCSGVAPTTTLCSHALPRSIICHCLFSEALHNVSLMAFGDVSSQPPLQDQHDHNSPVTKSRTLDFTTGKKVIVLLDHFSLSCPRRLFFPFR